jgi:hypothetical protein
VPCATPHAVDASSPDEPGRVWSPLAAKGDFIHHPLKL